MQTIAESFRIAMYRMVLQSLKNNFRSKTNQQSENWIGITCHPLY